VGSVRPWWSGPELRVSARRPEVAGSPLQPNASGLGRGEVSRPPSGWAMHQVVARA